MPRITFVNGGFTRITGLAADDVLGETLSVLPLVEDELEAAAALRRALYAGEPFHRDGMKMRRADGVECVFELQLMAVPEGAPRPVALGRHPARRDRARGAPRGARAAGALRLPDRPAQPHAPAGPARAGDPHGRPRERAPGALRDGPRPLQGDQRHVRPPVRRPAPEGVRAAPARGAAHDRHGGAAGRRRVRGSASGGRQRGRRGGHGREDPRGPREAVRDRGPEPRGVAPRSGSRCVPRTATTGRRCCAARTSRCTRPSSRARATSSTRRATTPSARAASL